MRNLVLADNDIIMDIYLNKPALTSKDIMRLFNCKSGAASNKKKQVLKWMKDHGKLSYSGNAIYTKTAFEVWNIDIADIEKRYMKKQKLKEKGVI